MKYNDLGQSGIKVSEVTMCGASPNADNFNSEEFKKQFSGILLAAYERGINFFDNAENYGTGASEIIMKEALGHIRQKIIISSKVGYDHVAALEIKKACEESLRRLGTDYIDVYYVHYPHEKADIGEVMSRMEELKKEGKIRAIGVCNFSRRQLEQAVKTGRIDVVQQCYSLLWRKNMEADVLPFCREHGISVVPFSPLAIGLLSGKFTRDWQFAPGDQRGKPQDSGVLLFQKEWFHACIDTVDKMKPVAARYNKTMAQLALNWVKSQEGIASFISGMKTGEQLSENLGALGWEISEEDMKALDEISRALTDRLPNYLHFFLKMVGTNSTV
jgi:aryl-alcohol dehydrogenase-like predicted oxidoreductase